MAEGRRRKSGLSIQIWNHFHFLCFWLMGIILLYNNNHRHTSILTVAAAEPFGSRGIVPGGLFSKSFQDLDAIEEHDLLQAIRVPFDDPRTQYFEGGLDGFPAYGLREGADIKSHYRLFLPDRLYRDFALLVTVKPDRTDTAYLFSVVNPLDTLVQFGVKVSPSPTSSQQMISLLYTDVHSHLVTQTLTSFEVPLMARKWNRFALKVVGDNITLYLNCKEHSSKVAMRNPKELTFDSASILYIGQAGPLLKGNFQNFSSGESSGDFDLNDYAYSYPEGDLEYNEDLGEAELGSAGFPPPIPGPPPAPPIDLNPLRNLMKGDKGQKGEPGPKGTEVRGPPGPPGPPGSPGLSMPKGRVPSSESGSGSGDEFSPFDTGGGYGTCSCNYTEILMQLPQTFRGLPGPPGEVGPAGPEGKQGPRGEKGDRGDIGGPGPEGLQGPKGEQGRLGEIGPPGPPGPPGSSAPPNFIGYDPDWRPRNLLKDQLGPMNRPMPGPKGEIGVPGPRGEKGERGYPGEKGERGHGTKGDKGGKGDHGARGAPGIDGLPGLKGEPGSPAPLNYLGNSLDSTPLRGEPGLIGSPGPIGPPGERGPPGLPGSFNLEAIKELLKDFKGEKGDPGPEGRRGRRGKPGPPGVSEIGPPGWPNTAKPLGRPGIPGSTGERGENGYPGAEGLPGPPGLSIVGPKGEKGEPAVLPDNFFNYEVVTRGPHYLPGPAGPPGLPGIKGEKGEAGIPSQGEARFTTSSTSSQGVPASHLHVKQTETISKIVPGAVVFLTREAMLKMSELSPVGTIAFVKDEESLFTRVSDGWKPLLMGDLIRAPILMAHPDPHTTELPRHFRQPPLEASSLTNRVVDGPSLRLAALNDPANGDTHGVRGADYSCYRQARNANLVGTFRALLASYVQNLDSIVKYTDRNLPVLNTKGELLFNSWSDIFDNGGYFLTKPPPIYSFNGRNVIQDFHWPQKMVWHGSDNAGIRATSSYCEAWHSDSVSNVGLASDLLRGQILGQENVGCNNKLVILCVEIASQQHYRRRRSIPDSSSEEFETEASTTSSVSAEVSSTSSTNFPLFTSTEENDLSHLHRNLTFEEYTQLIDDYDESVSNSNNVLSDKDISSNDSANNIRQDSSSNSNTQTKVDDAAKSQGEPPPVFEEQFN